MPQHPGTPPPQSLLTPPLAQQPMIAPSSSPPTISQPAVSPTSPFHPSPAASAAPPLHPHPVEGHDTPTKQLFDRITSEVAKIYVGQDELVLGALVALFSNGHVLIEAVPGLGKTLLIRALAKTFSGGFSRIQFTPDLMPSDVTGHALYELGIDRAFGHDHRRKVERVDVLALCSGSRKDHGVDVITLAKVTEDPRE